jgi:tRNA-specific 2-thiouridylase
MKKKIMVGMSGGVDSSVTAALLLKQGYEVSGMTMRVWKNTQDLAVADAQIVAKKLGIVHHVFDFREIFEKKVIQHFIDGYSSGKTPNPCVTCNHHIKFGEFLDKALSMGMDYIATGHYAKIEKEGDRYLLKKSASTLKDQTYPLYHLTQKQLSHVIFPLSNYEKTEVRKIATELGLSVANKPDSQDICFVADHDYVKFIEEKTGVKMSPGNFVDKSGKVLGEHKGLYHYTLGQRKGIGVATGKPIFVSHIDVEKNEITLGDEQDILSDSLIVADLNFIPMDKITEPIKAKAKIRYGMKEFEVEIIPIDDNKAKVVFKEPQRAVTAGQSIVFYQKDSVLGGGIIQ